MRQVKPASPTTDDAARPPYLGFVRLRRKGLSQGVSNGLRCQMPTSPQVRAADARLHGLPGMFVVGVVLLLVTGGGMWST